MLGQPLPVSARLISSRVFHTPAGGGEAYTYVQFTIDQQNFERLMSAAGFVAEPPTDPEFTQSEVTSFWRFGHFRHDLPFIARPVLYHKPGAPIYDNSSVLWDPDRQIAHAKRIQG
ncbi:MAG TPA: hypothetical protein VF624_02920 [Tepidisphaeraceae bacterium]